jgi:hypothetical protein
MKTHCRQGRRVKVLNYYAVLLLDYCLIRRKARAVAADLGMVLISRT